MKTWVGLANLYLMFLEKFMSTSHGNEGAHIHDKRHLLEMKENAYYYRVKRVLYGG